MSRLQSVSFYIDSLAEPQFIVLMAILRRLHVSFVRDGRIHLYVQTDDGRDYDSRNCSEQNAFDTIAVMLERSEIAAFDATVDAAGRSMLFNFDPSYDGQIVVTILGDCVEMPDGMIDFNWYYQFWKEKLDDFVTITGVEFSVHA